MFENNELQKFYTDMQEEIKSGLVSDEEGTTPEQIYTEKVLSLLAEAGETENYRVCYDEKVSKRGVIHKVNGYSLYETYDKLDLFITLYFDNDEIQSVTKTEAEKANDRLLKFFKNAINKNYINEIEESSQIFDLAHTLARVKDIRESLSIINIFLITNGQIKSDIKTFETVEKYSVFYRVIDINYMFNISDKERIPIEINFSENGFQVPCIVNDGANDEYQSYLGIISGNALAEIYGQYGARLLEQNVRSFLQFTGKYNRGIRDTILNEPHMFLAYNNGIAATAEEIELVDLPDNKGKGIGYVKDLQIVNGGQTTASIYHTWKQNKNVDTSKIFVQLKLTIIKNKDNFGTIIGKIAEFANTQNKVSAADLSSNREYYIILEKLSRTIWAPPSKDQVQQTHWFFERARGQYKNARLREGFTNSKKKAFDLMNPRNQLLTKENLAKYLNLKEEIFTKGNKLVIAPHIIVRGNEKNYAYFLKYNFDEKPDSIFFENLIAHAILFKSSEKIYGIKPNALGDMRYITVPYSIGWLGLKLDYKLDLYKIWKNQEISTALKTILKEIMIAVERFIIHTAPGSLYGEWAKKEECWNQIIKEDFGINLNILSDDLETDDSPRRKNMTDSDIEDNLMKSELELIKSIPLNKWNEINKMGVFIEELTPTLKNRAINIQSTLKMKKQLSEIQRKDAITIIDIIVHKSPDFFDENDPNNVNVIINKNEITSENNSTEENELTNENQINADEVIPTQMTTSLLRKMVDWDIKTGVLSPKQRLYVYKFVYENKKMNSFDEKNLARYLQTLVNAGFDVN
ncbi:AIPR protein [uncultured archaeon]|nr:AIPR protein [uncultured archaeon]